MPRWGCRYGRFWAVQWVIGPWVSLGVHLDLSHHVDGRGRHFGPYIDLHLVCVTVSLGYNPIYSGDLERALSISRGGI